MPVLINARHERFALNLAAGLNQITSYERAGYRRNIQGASRLARSEHVLARVAELQKEWAEKMRIDREALIEFAEEARQLAMDTEQPAAAVSAIKEIGVLTGLRIERRDNTVRSVNELSDHELAEIARGGGIDIDSVAFDTIPPKKLLSDR